MDKVDIEGQARPATSVFRGPRKEVVLGGGLAGKPRGRNNYLRKYPEHSWTWTSQSVKVSVYRTSQSVKSVRLPVVWGANTPPQLRRALSGGAGEKQPEKSRREAGEKTEIAEREEWWLDDANEG